MRGELSPSDVIRAFTEFLVYCCPLIDAVGLGAKVFIDFREI